MSSSKRRFLLALPLAVLVAACGFEPVYAPGGTGAALRGQVEFDIPDTRDGYLLTRNLEERLGRTQVGSYHLSVKPSVTSEGQAVTKSGDITRFSLVGRASYVLRRVSDESIVASGTVENFTGYSATGTTVETLASQDDARDRLMVILADQITARIYSTADLSG
ncbi:LPS assembly lipoprotein LptE [Albibacillus kandeliae]|uniref:LPS assembly lipoprotein LptE n=1 Tax=Albibacillus kandeliae TaxID=2174228 RepID=UPI000D68DD07|nr:LPS assembly lipoprotein LptE [Albibacillus kandeliae]